MTAEFPDSLMYQAIRAAESRIREPRMGRIEYPMAVATAAVRAAAEVLHEAWLAGRTVVDLPEPDTQIGDTAFWEIAEVGATAVGGIAMVSDFGEHLDPGGARCRAVALLAAAGRAEQSAAEQSAGEVSTDG